MSEGEENTVDDLRQRGNHEFQEGKLDNAVVYYTMAIEKAKKERTESTDEQTKSTLVAACIVNLCNRSACYYQMEDYERARDDAQEAWTLSDEINVKAAYRLAKTLLALSEFEKAMKTLNTALALPKLEDKEKKSLHDLLQQAKDGKMKEPKKPETTIKGVDRPISIREFIKTDSLGVGNFSEIVIAQHRVTNEQFALKILEKKQAADLAKRQHPNVYNEIQMEARALMERLPPHPNMVSMYHAFSDYNNLYYLMDLHNVNPDLWTMIRYQGKMVGCHPSQTKIWLWQLIGAIEHLHNHGIVHRDLKPENILLNDRNQVIVIDFGTAKDLVKTDLNGPEFVGTPDFMSPEAVTGFSGMPKDDKKYENGATHSADLWALGAVAYILHTGETPFWSPSPYLAFLKIKRGLLTRSQWGIPDDKAWDFIHKLMHVDPTKRLGADCYGVEDGKVSTAKGYDLLRNHAYFGDVSDSKANDINPVPSLRDLCVRACAELAKKDACDLDICDQHPPGDGSSHDMMRLAPMEKKSVLHVLDKLKLFANGDETRVLNRFVSNDIDYLDIKLRPESRDFVGLTQMNDDEGKPQSARGSGDPYAKKDEPEPVKMVHLTNPLLLLDGNEDIDEETRKKYIKGWKKCISTINRARPKIVVVSGKINDKCKKFLSRISDSIAVILNDGSSFYSFWNSGFQVLVLQSKTLQPNSNGDIDSPQMLWIREQMEQCRMSKHQLFAFVDCDPRDLNPLVVKRLTRGRVLVLVGLSNKDSKEDEFETKISYEANEKVNDDVSVKSTDSVEDKKDESTMKVMGSKQNAMRWITVFETEKWTSSYEYVSVEPTFLPQP